MITRTIGVTFGALLRGLVGLLTRAQIHPDLLTVLGLLVTAFAAACYAHGSIRLGGVIVFVAGAFDMVDGRVARQSNRETKFGAFLDSVIDRYSDLFLYSGILVLFARRGSTGYVALTMVALIGSILVSYTRARAENLIAECKVGFMERPERIVLLILGSILDRLPTALWILALTSHLAVFHRIYYTRKVLRNQDRPGARALEV
jgi:CDP-diacylglycerol--glycerol-3-phosphate 3-phosphatidyltransferase